MVTQSLIDHWDTVQADIASSVVILPDEEEYDEGGLRTEGCLYGGLDIGYSTDQTRPPVSAYVVMRKTAGGFETVYRSHAEEKDVGDVPYVAGYLAFREVEPLLRLVEEQRRARPEMNPQLLMVDGNGLLHPRRAGLACFVGVRTGIPTLGIGKALHEVDGLAAGPIRAEIRRRLEDRSESGNDGDVDGGTRPVDMGTIEAHRRNHTVSPNTPPQRGRPAYFRLVGRSGDVLAAALVQHGGRGGSRNDRPAEVPIYISVGSGISLLDAVSVCADTALYRIPEPVRVADLFGREILSAGGIRCKENGCEKQPR